jgi:hypothetical protein
MPRRVEPVAATIWFGPLCWKSIALKARQSFWVNRSYFWPAIWRQKRIGGPYLLSGAKISFGIGPPSDSWSAGLADSPFSDLFNLSPVISKNWIVVVALLTQQFYDATLN